MGGFNTLIILTQSGDEFLRSFCLSLFCVGDQGKYDAIYKINHFMCTILCCTKVLSHLLSSS